MNSTDTKAAQRPLLEKLLFGSLILLFLNSGYLAAFSHASLFHLINVFLHVGLGIFVLVLVLWHGLTFLREETPKGNDIARYFGYLGYWLLLAGMGIGVYLTVAGVHRWNEWLVGVHSIGCLLAIVLLIKAIRNIGHQISISNPINTAGRLLMVFAVVSLCLPLLAQVFGLIFPEDDGLPKNPAAAPATLAGLAMGGESGPFFASAAASTVQDTLATSFLNDSKTCGQAGCHVEIYKQWQSSAHSFSALQSLWYKPAYAAVQQQAGNAAAQWCAGCHTPALLLAGAADLSPAQQEQHAQAHAAIGCTACHGVVRVSSTLGQGNYVMGTPGLFSLADSENPLLRKLYAWFVHLDPQPHREAYRKPVLTTGASEFCSTCHKAAVDHPLKPGGWLEVMNDYDSWQNSGYSRQAVRDFYRPKMKQSCIDCHMARVPSQDPAATDASVPDHRFLGANTALAVWRDNPEQLAATRAFLQDGKITVDIFAASLSASLAAAPQTADSSGAVPAPIETRVASASLCGDQENFWNLVPGTQPPAPTTAFIAPIDRQEVTVHPGESVRIDVVVRSRNIGHHFPAGAADMAEAWVEFLAIDNHGQVICWSGGTDGRVNGSIDPKAHRFGAALVDSLGRRLYHFESWKAAGVSFLNLLPPNSAEVIRYRFTIPPSSGEQIRLIATVNYRKIQTASLALLGGGNAEPAPATSRPLPVIQMARAEALLHVDYNLMRHQSYMESYVPADKERWNDYGIGLLRQNDLAGAERAFLAGSVRAPLEHNPWINLGIVWLKSGKVVQAKTALQHALSIAPSSSRGRYFLSLAWKAEGNYDAALDELKEAIDNHEGDRNLHLEMGRLHFLRQDYSRAIRAFENALRIDPQNATAYFYLKECYTAREEAEEAERMNRLYLRFRRDDRMVQLQHAARALEPWLEGEPQRYHEHGSADLKYWNSSEADATNGHDE
ncbi:MAG: tetratricopeptide repeat protein [candidate division KSB1 bacterium]|nr:tetratricopeptide repeat protein [candidate division KSB1 bacterium]MDZ7272774.1 tetratricopeptide repeat protein [candidate division KSB1 bacterium]MDZ7284202.1 tetratricopeptide repeat protein [candidate division KSB1 bacterium]MDZ7297400.1 tetratricopeptide repeat protein [candidate division KSB1 bacterium]MDZ7306540.1 tetratricopeptide repeat protein [candidate division KSB1 bacterium]